MNYKLTVLKFVKIREFYEILKFIKFEFSIYGAGGVCVRATPLRPDIEQIARSVTEQ